MNNLDLVVIAVVALSGLFAFVRGFVREALSIIAWIGAGVVTARFYDALFPSFAHWITSPLLAQITTVLVLFVAALLLFSILVGVLSSRVRASSFGSLDRAVGLVFGVLRGTFAVCLAYLIFDTSQVIPRDSWPTWLTQARTQPLLASGAAEIKAVTPASWVDEGAEAANKAGQAVGKAARSEEFRENPPQTGGNLNDLLERREDRPPPKSPPDRNGDQHTQLQLPGPRPAAYLRHRWAMPGTQSWRC